MRRGHIYASQKHVFVTLAFVAVPFLVFLLFSRLLQVNPLALFEDLGVSFLRMAAAFFIAAILGWIFAVLFYKGRRAAVVLPLFDILESFPAFAALPIATYFWGPTNFTIIFFLVIAIIWPIFFSTISSLKLIRRDWHDVAKINHVSGWHYINYYLWPITLPGLVTGSIVGLAAGWEALIATEMIIQVKSGLGIFFLNSVSNSTVTIFGICTFLFVIFVINKLLILPLLEWSHQQIEE